jgi:hypothetical protein
MFSAALGISMLAHITIILAAKVNAFFRNLGFYKSRKTGPKLINRSRNRAFTSLAIALITESIFLLVIFSSVSTLSAGIYNDKSNYKILKGAMTEFKDKSVSLSCLISEDCYHSPPDASIPLG